ncbi:zinc finger protein 675-like isoform X2 [Plodia interpunctella]|uniref:zinc finger protein 675-like isoform X2 n=1 Tax=Plodia interpunctella TaxID=58824 RepID=UPI00236808B0|nr:zinc finger protein 675-like isoform X2 [Plodia interpunctella]
MDIIKIKDEFYTKDQCHTCLSVGRKLKPIGEYIDIYKKIVSDFSLQSHHLGPDNMKYLHITLSNLTSILLNETQPNIIYINEAAIKTEETHETLSEIYDNDHFDDAPVSKVKTESIVDAASEITDSDHINLPTNEIKLENLVQKPKRINKWAVKNAQRNKKPKFELIEDYKECYSTIKLSGNEIAHLVQINKNKYSKLKYCCRNCLNGFNNPSLLEKHIMECQKDPVRYICDVCKKGFLDKNKLSTHIQGHYCRHRCILCSYTSYDERNMKSHAEKEHKIALKCLKCSLIFVNRREFFKHYKEWHEKYTCDHCGISFKMRYSIEDHIRKVHSPFECKPCNKKFARYGGLWRHRKTKHSTAPSVGAYCVECDKHYENIFQYKSHLNNSARHRGKHRKQRYPCLSCDKVFTKNIYMRDHYNLVHLKIIRHRCEECNKIFVRNADLMSHKRRVHEGIAPPRNKICDICGRGFTTRKILTHHVRTHTGERPHACACGAAFAQRAALAAHARASAHYIPVRR